MALRDDLKLYIPQLLNEILSHPTGYIVSNEEYNNRWNLIRSQGDDTANKVRLILDMLYETILSDTDGASHINLVDAEFTETTLKAILLELATRIATNRSTSDAADAANKAISDAMDADLLAQIQSNDVDIATNASNLNVHKSGADHDGRYYTGSTVDGLVDTLQLQINTNDADIVTLNNLIATLNATYSTDVERIAAINQIVNDYEAADNSITTMLGEKANTADVYTKAQIDNMTLGSYKMEIYPGYDTFTADFNTIPVNVAGFNYETDYVMLFIGGIQQRYSVDWVFSADGLSIEKVSGVWEASASDNTLADWTVIRNLRVLTPEDQFEGALIKDGTVLRNKLHSVITSELDTLRADLDTKATNSILATKAVITKGTATIPTTGWVANTGEYTLKLDLAIAGILATDWVDITIDKDSITVASDAEMCPTITEYVGGVTLYAKTVPTVAIPIEWKVVR